MKGVRWVVGLFVVLLLVGCAGSKEAEDGKKKPRRLARSAPELPQPFTLNLAEQDPKIKSVQLHNSAGEALLPIAEIRSRESLTLAFDILDSRGESLDVYFYHADQSWNRDLAPAEYLGSFQRDNILNYTPSRATEVEYSHYRYTFPNNNINFLISGNYIVRVTESGYEDEPLFERPFFITEQATSLGFELDNVMVSGRGFSSIMPIVRFQPPSDLQASIFDYNVCFVQNGLLTHARCTDRAFLAQQPTLQFFLEDHYTFAPADAQYFMDVSQIRPGGDIEATEMTRSPFAVYLEPDYARFTDGDNAPLLNRQAIISTAPSDVPEPEINAEYVWVHFSYVPQPEARVGGPVYVIGSFNGWAFTPDTQLQWNFDTRRYEGRVLIKQGQYEYQFASPDPFAQRNLAQGLPQFQNLYTAFVYVRDVRLATDRLLAVSDILTQ